MKSHQTKRWEESQEDDCAWLDPKKDALGRLGCHRVPSAHCCIKGTHCRLYIASDLMRVAKLITRQQT